MQNALSLVAGHSGLALPTGAIARENGLLGRLRFGNDGGAARFFKNQTYHHAVLRALNQVAAQGADTSEILRATTRMRAGDEQNWYAEWSALGDRNLARARSARNARSRGEALLRAHTYYARAQFYLPPEDSKRPAAYDLCRRVFYEGLDILGVPYERALVNARSVTTRVYDKASGGHEHSQLGAPTLWQADFFDWMEEKFG